MIAHLWKDFTLRTLLFPQIMTGGRKRTDMTCPHVGPQLFHSFHPGGRVLVYSPLIPSSIRQRKKCTLHTAILTKVEDLVFKKKEVKRNYSALTLLEDVTVFYICLPFQKLFMTARSSFSSSILCCSKLLSLPLATPSKCTLAIPSR